MTLLRSASIEHQKRMLAHLEAQERSVLALAAQQVDRVSDRFNGLLQAIDRRAQQNVSRTRDRGMNMAKARDGITDEGNGYRAPARLPVPELDAVDVAFGNIKHMPKYDTLSDAFRDMSDPHCRAVSTWFYKGAGASPNGILIDGVTFTARPGVDKRRALAAIRAILGSFEPKHEHKIAACGFMLSQWFDRAPA